MSEARPRRTRLGVWCVLAALLLAWNGVAASFANPFRMIQAYDGTQYHLLARNRLHGHRELGESAHTVRDEGRHPIWRPGLVWIEEALARCLGSVWVSAAVASAVGTTLLEVALLWLAWRCYGWAVGLVVLVCLLSPIQMGNVLILAVGQGPEPWAAAAVLAALAALVEARRRRSWSWAILAGALAALAEWFRTGNQLLFAMPCVVYAVACWWQRDRRWLALPATAVGSLVVFSAVSGLLMPSAVNKNTVNLWHRMVEFHGEQASYTDTDNHTTHVYLGGLVLAPDSTEAFYDYIVNHSRGLSTWIYFREHISAILGIYADGLGQVLKHGASGLREMTGWLLLFCFGAEVLINLSRRVEADVNSLAFAAGALAQYLGPIVLVRGDAWTHYSFMILPLFILVGARGAVRLVELAYRTVQHHRPGLAAQLQSFHWFALALVLAPLACLSVMVYQASLHDLASARQHNRNEQASIDALELAGHKIATRNMTWFVDRNVTTVLLPYATVPELEDYARVQEIDGVLICWDEQHEPHFLFRVMPYSTLQEFESAMRSSKLFGPPRVQGGWRWYPVLRDRSAQS